MTQTQTTTENKKTEAAKMLDEFVYFVCPNDELDLRLARAYMRNLGPDTRAKLVTELRPLRLTERHTVIVLYRAESYAPQPSLELSVGKPIRALDHWVIGNEEQDGQVNFASFMTAMGQTCLPAHIKYRDDEGILRLGYA